MTHGSLWTAINIDIRNLVAGPDTAALHRAKLERFARLRVGRALDKVVNDNEDTLNAIKNSVIAECTEYLAETTSRLTPRGASYPNSLPTRPAYP